MNPVEITQGKSFKGLSAYLLQDENRETSERVGWSDTRNLAGADPDQAWRLMLATANSAGALKEAAGIKQGKPVKNTVYHYSINFNPEDEVTPEIRQSAVDGSLKALGLEDHQVMAVEHTDKAHNHVHVMVNLIDSANGMSAASPQMCDDGKKRSKLSNSQRKLSSWAQKFERDNGLTVTEGRLSNANKRSRGERVDAQRKTRNVHERQKRERTTDRRKNYIKREQNDRAKDIQYRSNELKEKSADQWDALKFGYGVQQKAIKDEMSPAMKARSAEIKELFKPYWADMFKRHRDELKAFEAGDRSAIGRIWTAAAVFKDRALDGDYLGGFVAAFSKENRRNIVLKKHDREREDMSRAAADQRTQEIGKMKHEFDRQFEKAREQFLKDSTALKAEQDQAWKEIRDEWKQYNQERQNAFTVKQDRGQTNEQAQGMSQGRGRTPS